MIFRSFWHWLTGHHPQAWTAYYLWGSAPRVFARATHVHDCSDHWKVALLRAPLPEIDYGPFASPDEANRFMRRFFNV